MWYFRNKNETTVYLEIRKLYPVPCIPYSDKAKFERAHSGAGLLLYDKYIKAINEIAYASDMILKVSLNQTILHTISIYAPDISKPKDKSEQFYAELQNMVEVISITSKKLSYREILTYKYLE